MKAATFSTHRRLSGVAFMLLMACGTQEAPLNDDALRTTERLQADSIAAGGDRSCAIVAGKGWCWGASFVGLSTLEGQQLLGMEYGPRSIARFPGAITSIAVDTGGACALANRVDVAALSGVIETPDDGKPAPRGAGRPTPYCWGLLNLQGSGSVGYERVSDNPELVGDFDLINTGTGIDDSARIWMGGADSTLCSISETAGLRCTTGGNGAEDLSELKDKKMVEVAIGPTHRCATDGANVWCWGNNKYGQLGVGDTAARRAPTAVQGLAGTILHISAGSMHSCVSTSVAVYCFGSNALGQLGDANRSVNALRPRALQAFPGAVSALASGFGHSCAVWKDKVYCWGNNDFAQSGKETTSSSNTLLTQPQVVAGIDGTPKALALGAQHSCALTSSGVACWGSNTDGQLGTGDRRLFQSAVARMVRLRAPTAAEAAR